MSINEMIIGLFAASTDDGIGDPESVRRMLDGKTSYWRRKRAMDFIKSVMSGHGKEDLLPTVAELARVEQRIKELAPWARDHVVHAVLCYVLGTTISNNYFSQNGRIEVDTFQWKLASLFHDVGYPVQLAKKVWHPFADKINHIGEQAGATFDKVVFQLVPQNLDKLLNNQNSLNLIQTRLNDWQLQIDVVAEYNNKISTGEVCHGMVSALAVLKCVDFFYQQYNHRREHYDIFTSGTINWNQNYFENDVVSACSAIFIHNLPSASFDTAKIDRRVAPLAFLLKLSDSLQEWQRPSMKEPTGQPAENFDLVIDHGRMVLRANISDERIEEINADIQGALVAPDIGVVRM